MVDLPGADLRRSGSSCRFTSATCCSGPTRRSPAPRATWTAGAPRSRSPSACPPARTRRPRRPWLRPVTQLRARTSCSPVRGISGPARPPPETVPEDLLAPLDATMAELDPQAELRLSVRCARCGLEFRPCWMPAAPVRGGRRHARRLTRGSPARTTLPLGRTRTHEHDRSRAQPLPRPARGEPRDAGAGGGVNGFLVDVARRGRGLLPAPGGPTTAEETAAAGPSPAAAPGDLADLPTEAEPTATEIAVTPPGRAQARHALPGPACRPRQRATKSRARRGVRARGFSDARGRRSRRRAARGRTSFRRTSFRRTGSRRCSANRRGCATRDESDRGRPCGLVTADAGHAPDPHAGDIGGAAGADRSCRAGHRTCPGRLRGSACLPERAAAARRRCRPDRDPRRGCCQPAALRPGSTATSATRTGRVGGSRCRAPTGTSHAALAAGRRRRAARSGC